MRIQNLGLTFSTLLLSATLAVPLSGEEVLSNPDTAKSTHDSWEYLPGAFSIQGSYTVGWVYKNPLQVFGRSFGHLFQVTAQKDWAISDHFGLSAGLGIGLMSQLAYYRNYPGRALFVGADTTFFRFFTTLNPEISLIIPINKWVELRAGLDFVVGWQAYNFVSEDRDTSSSSRTETTHLPAIAEDNQLFRINFYPGIHLGSRVYLGAKQQWYIDTLLSMLIALRPEGEVSRSYAIQANKRATMLGIRLGLGYTFGKISTSKNDIEALTQK